MSFIRVCRLVTKAHPEADVHFHARHYMHTDYVWIGRTPPTGSVWHKYICILYYNVLCLDKSEACCIRSDRSFIQKTYHPEQVLSCGFLYHLNQHGRSPHSLSLSHSLWHTGKSIFSTYRGRFGCAVHVTHKRIRTRTHARVYVCWEMLLCVCEWWAITARDYVESLDSVGMCAVSGCLLGFSGRE